MLKQKYLKLLEANQFKPYDIAMMKIQVFVKEEDEELESIVLDLCNCVRSFSNTIADPILKSIEYFEKEDLKQSLRSKLKSSKTTKETIDINSKVKIIEIELNTFVINSKLLMELEALDLLSCTVQTDFLKFKLD